MQVLQKIRQFWYRLSARAHLRRGVKLYRDGQFAPAVTHLQTALLLGGPSFTAHLHLGKIFLRLGRFDRARREFDQARRLDPARFAARGLPEDVLLEMAQRFYQPLWAGPRADEDEDLEMLPGDDFSSDAERDRFRILPPIEPEDVEDVDLEDLARRLLR